VTTATSDDRMLDDTLDPQRLVMIAASKGDRDKVQSRIRRFLLDYARGHGVWSTALLFAHALQGAHWRSPVGRAVYVDAHLWRAGEQLMYGNSPEQVDDLATEVRSLQVCATQEWEGELKEVMYFEAGREEHETDAAFEARVRREVAHVVATCRIPRFATLPDLLRALQLLQATVEFTLTGCRGDRFMLIDLNRRAAKLTTEIQKRHAKARKDKP